MCRCCSARSSRRWRRCAASGSTAPSARAAMRAACSTPAPTRVIGDRPRPRGAGARGGLGRRLRRSAGRCAQGGSATSTGSPARRSTAWCSTSASRRCRSTRPARGFSFLKDGPLDMRMEQAGPSAADLVNGAPEALIADILHQYGEERAARRIARAIVAARKAQALRDHAGARRGRSSAACRGRSPASRTPRPAASRRCASRSTTSWASSRAGSPPPRRRWRRAAGWRW